MPHIRSLRSAKHHRFQSVFGVGQCALGEKNVLLKGRHLSLRLHHVYGREQTLLDLPPVARVLLLGQTYGFDLHLQIAVGVFEFPVVLNGLRHHLDDALPKLRVGELDILSRDFACDAGYRRRATRARAAASG